MKNLVPTMNIKTQKFTNFGHALKTTSKTIRPDNEDDVQNITYTKTLARGQGLSYNDSCLNHHETIIDTSRLNHILSFDEKTGIVTCQGGVTFADLFSVHAEYIPPVMPGTLSATIAGGIAHDVHGKNNPKAGSFGHHIVWLELQIGSRSFFCSEEEHKELFHATIAGLGLTGIIKRAGIQLSKETRFVSQKTESWTDLKALLHYMQHKGSFHDYQVAWLDLLQTFRALSTVADHSARQPTKLLLPPQKSFSIPKLPFCMVRHSIMKAFNRIYYHRAKAKTRTIPLWQFNNPLDTLHNWANLYGPQGLLQFQAVFDAQNASHTLETLINIVHQHHASPTLAVLKYFNQSGNGLLSFVQPGFTIAIDFANTANSRLTIAAMNQYIADVGGKVYLAKDTLLNRNQFATMYPKCSTFRDCLTEYQSPMHSDLSQRLDIGPLSS